MRKFLVLTVFLIIVVVAGPIDAKLQISGYYKNFSTGLASPLPDEPIIGAVNNRLRLNCTYAPPDPLSFDLSYDFAPRIQDPSLFSEPPIAGAAGSLHYRVADFDSTIYPGENAPDGSFGLFQNLDRASIGYGADFGDITIGRQAIAWGSARVVNPTDVIAPYAYNQLDTEDRIGVDAIRVQIPIGVLGEFDAGYVFGENLAFERSAFFLRSQLNAVETDFSILLLGFHEHLMTGFDIARGIGGAGFWLEAAYVYANAFDSENPNAENYLRASMGLDYSFGGVSYGFIEYHFSGAGAQVPEDYLANLDRPAYTDGAVYLMGKHYFVPGLTFQITPLISLSGVVLSNIADPSVFPSLQIEYNFAQDIYLSAGGFIGIGRRPETENEETQFRSEFGGYPTLFFSSFRIYF
ncbi:hypothetical protein F4X33_03340 [Candidatus Poribacteria bacterium]|nr:hypothetical protein [Candidatus Poribacteria bacterium]